MIYEKSNFRIITSSYKTATENMAEDEALLKSFNTGDYAILRLYTWKKNSVTIGISQDFSNYSFFENFDGSFAKRVTGGGILFHGHDVSYSLVIPVDFLRGFNIKQSYENICKFILKFYENLGLDTCYAKDDKNISLSKNEFCQVGFEAYDILVNGKKIGGNAQRRTKKAIFQHGSIPIYSVKKSNTTEDPFGLSLEDIEIHIDFEKTKKMLINAFNETFDVNLHYSQLNEKEKENKEKLLKDKYDYANE